MYPAFAARRAPEMLCLNSSSSSLNQTKSQGKVQLILPLDQGVILRWFILGSHHNSHALTPREIFMLNDFHIKNTVYLPDGNTVSGKRVYVHTKILTMCSRNKLFVVTSRPFDPSPKWLEALLQIFIDRAR